MHDPFQLPQRGNAGYFLKENGIIGIEGIDTRSLTRILRESGVMNGAITTEFDPETEPEKLAALMPIIKLMP